MAIISIDLLEVGMVLKSAVCDRSGRLLLPAGSDLTDKHLKIFRTWGITEADILLGPDEIPAEGASASDSRDPALLTEAEQATALLFTHNDPQHPMINELMKICLERRLAVCPPR